MRRASWTTQSPNKQIERSCVYSRTNLNFDDDAYQRGSVHVIYKEKDARGLHSGKNGARRRVSIEVGVKIDDGGNGRDVYRVSESSG